MSTATETQAITIPRLKQKYNDEVKGALKTELDLANVMQVPRMEKIVVNMGVGRATQQPSLLEGAVKDQRPEANHHEGTHVDRQFQAP
jgi:large subunit ribosomal protein L5